MTDRNINLVPKKIIHHWQQTIKAIKLLKKIAVKITLMLPILLISSYNTYNQYFACSKSLYLKNTASELIKLKEEQTYQKNNLNEIKNFKSNSINIIEFITSAPKGVFYKSFKYQDCEIKIDACIKNYELIELWVKSIKQNHSAKNLLITQCEEGKKNVIDIGIQFNISLPQNTKNNTNCQ